MTSPRDKEVVSYVSVPRAGGGVDPAFAKGLLNPLAKVKELLRQLDQVEMEKEVAIRRHLQETVTGLSEGATTNTQLFDTHLLIIDNEGKAKGLIVEFEGSTKDRLSVLQELSDSVVKCLGCKADEEDEVVEKQEVVMDADRVATNEHLKPSTEKLNRLHFEQIQLFRDRLAELQTRPLRATPPPSAPLVPPAPVAPAVPQPSQDEMRELRVQAQEAKRGLEMALHQLKKWQDDSAAIKEQLRVASAGEQAAVRHAQLLQNQLQEQIKAAESESAKPKVVIAPLLPQPQIDAIKKEMRQSFAKQEEGTELARKELLREHKEKLSAKDHEIVDLRKQLAAMEALKGVAVAAKEKLEGKVDVMKDTIEDLTLQLEEVRDGEKSARKDAKERAKELEERLKELAKKDQSALKYEHEAEQRKKELELRELKAQASSANSYLELNAVQSALSEFFGAAWPDVRKMQASIQTLLGRKAKGPTEGEAKVASKEYVRKHAGSTKVSPKTEAAFADLEQMQSALQKSANDLAKVRPQDASSPAPAQKRPSRPFRSLQDPLEAEAERVMHEQMAGELAAALERIKTSAPFERTKNTPTSSSFHPNARQSSDEQASQQADQASQQTQQGPQQTGSTLQQSEAAAEQQWVTELMERLHARHREAAETWAQRKNVATNQSSPPTPRRTSRAPSPTHLSSDPNSDEASDGMPNRDAPRKSIPLPAVCFPPTAPGSFIGPPQGVTPAGGSPFPEQQIRRSSQSPVPASAIGPNQGGRKTSPTPVLPSLPAGSQGNMYGNMGNSNLNQRSAQPLSSGWSNDVVTAKQSGQSPMLTSMSVLNQGGTNQRPGPLSSSGWGNDVGAFDQSGTMPGASSAPTVPMPAFMPNLNLNFNPNVDLNTGLAGHSGAADLPRRDVRGLDSASNLAALARETAIRFADQTRDSSAGVARGDSLSNLAFLAQEAAIPLVGKSRDSTSNLLGQSRASIGNLPSRAHDSRPNLASQSRDSKGQWVLDVGGHVVPRDALSHLASQLRNSIKRIAVQSPRDSMGQLTIVAIDTIGQVSTQSDDGTDRPLGQSRDSAPRPVAQPRDLTIQSPGSPARDVWASALSSESPRREPKPLGQSRDSTPRLVAQPRDLTTQPSGLPARDVWASALSSESPRREPKPTQFAFSLPEPPSAKPGLSVTSPSHRQQNLKTAMERAPSAMPSSRMRMNTLATATTVRPKTSSARHQPKDNHWPQSPFSST